MELLDEIDVKGAMENFPTTRYMGSKRKILNSIWDIVKNLNAKTALDAFSGSGCVSYLFKKLGMKVTSNDYLAYSYYISKATVENSEQRLSKSDLDDLLGANRSAKKFIQNVFNGLYFTPSDNKFLDNLCANIKQLRNPYKHALATAAVCRAAMKKQPRGVFTVTGSRYNDGRADLKLTMEEQFIRAVDTFNEAVFDNGQSNRAMNSDIFAVGKAKYDLVYIDPPYYSKHSDNDYLRRYHFLEGLTSYWEDVELLKDTKTRRIAKRPTPFSSRKDCYSAFDKLFSNYCDSKLLVSYSSNSLPTKEEMVEMLGRYCKKVEVISVQHKYSFGNQRHRVGDNKNDVSEYLFLGY